MTGVRVRNLRPTGKEKPAYLFELHVLEGLILPDCKVWNGKPGELRGAPPSKMTKSGRWVDVAEFSPEFQQSVDLEVKAEIAKLAAADPKQ